MTGSEKKPHESVDEEVAHLKQDADAMERSDRAIPLPSSEDEDDDGIGQITGLVP